MNRTTKLPELRRAMAAILAAVLTATVAVASATGAHAQVAPPSPNVVVTSGSATAWIQRDVSTGGGAPIRIVGEGWTAPGGGASTIALKLNYRGAGGEVLQYTRSGSGIIQHPSAPGDSTIWVLLAAGGGGTNVYPIAADGSFDITFDAPVGLVAGQYLSVQFQSGLFQAGDTPRSETSDPLVVGGVPYEGGGEQQEPTCVPTSSTATVEIVESTVAFGGQLHVRGTGWCHPGANRGGSTIAFKIDEGAYSHLPQNEVHPNRTIWAIQTANASNGTFDVRITLPDGTAATSDPALPAGSHTLRLLTGSLKPGDAVRTVLSQAFVVGGEYRPNGTPPPVEATEDLTPAARGGVTVARTATALTVTVPGASAGDWIFLTAYAADGSPRYPWGTTWFRAESGGRVTASLTGVTLPDGAAKLAVQSGNEGSFGVLLGWSELPPAQPGAPGGVSCPSTPRSFRDVPTTSVHRDAVGCLAGLGIVLGRSDGSFDPAGTVRRDQASSMLARLLDAFGLELPTGPSFADVASGAPHATAISSLAALGIIEGRGAGRFDPAGSLTRAQAATILVRAVEAITEQPLPAGPDAFDDDTGSPHQANINRAAAAGLLRGTGARAFAPGEPLRRDQLASILANAIEQLG